MFKVVREYEKVENRCCIGQQLPITTDRNHFFLFSLFPEFKKKLHAGERGRLRLVWQHQNNQEFKKSNQILQNF